VKRFVRSETFARTRLVTGGLFILLGIAIVVRTVAEVGLVGAAVPAYVLGGAMIALGAFRFRDYRAMRRPR